ncbi:DUF3298 and DUF4163 domain-containing protein [Dyadobacter tibetensis]|uniref:DUF3298 and DUF4163 domain-containing protein n=1 Tax=Dyadobacter tibetensis TaxID=1211851 RepID=UPI0004724A5A|nr:DUF3298 and DUF4163 domain-containing protein [Dyadobacter tibetensis]
MKKWLGLGCGGVLALGLAMTGCGGGSDEQGQLSSGQAKLKGSFASEEWGICDTTGGARVELAYWVPEGKDSVNSLIKKTLERKVIDNILSDAGGDLEDTLSKSSAEAAYELFNKNYRDLKSEYPDAPGCWEVGIKGDTVMTTPQFLFYVMEHYAYTGGAHPNTFQSDYIFDRSTGKLIDGYAFVTDSTALLKLVESEFRKLEKLGPQENLEEAGYFLVNHSFFLPANFTFTQKGIRLYYNPYEIAAYVRGAIALEIPYSDLNGMVDKKRIFGVIGDPHPGN